jgi:signal peptidase I
VGSDNGKRRSEKEGIVHFSREMTSALLMAVVFIVYVIQAFKIPTGSMEDSLLVGDFLLGLKFMYGAPMLPLGLTYHKFPGVTNPKPGDVIIFRYPGLDKKDYIKRCVAGPGQTIETKGMRLIVDGKELVPPPRGKFEHNGQLGMPEITEFAPLHVPAKGDVIVADSLPVREFLFLKNLVRQENPRSSVRMELQLYVNGEFANDAAITSPMGYGATFTFNDLNRRAMLYRSSSPGPVGINDIDMWTDLYKNVENLERVVQAAQPGKQVEIRRVLYLDGTLLHRYTVRHDNYFMMGDNRDNSADSRYWGYLNRNFIKAKAFILYFSWNSYSYCPTCKTYRAPNGHNYHDPDGRGDKWCQVCGGRLERSVPIWMKIRWNRIGKLIRPWDGQPKTAAGK